MDKPDRRRNASFGVICLWAVPLILAGYVLVSPFVWKWTGERRVGVVEYKLPSGAVGVDTFVFDAAPPWVETVYAPVMFLREAPLIGPVLNGCFEFVEKL
jgi:hypothetical protein